MQSKDSTSAKSDIINPSVKAKVTGSSHVVIADSVQSEEVPTIPLGSLQTLGTLQPEVTVHSVTSSHSLRLPAPLVIQPSEYRRSLGEWLQVWWDGMRPGYLPLSLLPVLLGSTLAWTQTIAAKTPFGHFHVQHFIATFLAVVVIQMGAHLVNDYYDYVKGIDMTNVLGPGGLIQQGFIKPITVLNCGLVLLCLGAILGAVVAASGGLLLYLFGLLGLLCAYFYSATSRGISSLALGELVSFFVFGPLLTLGAFIVQAGYPNRLLLINVLLYSVPLGLFATAFVHLNNLRDIESDSQAKKWTIASFLGVRLSRTLYLLLVLGAYAMIVALGVPRNAPHLVLLTLWALPTLVVVISGIMRADMPTSLHLVMRETVKLETYFSLLLIAALIISALWIVLPHIPAHLLPI